ncbi:MAG: discoidin domain-containing protein [Anaerolineae bacterium]|nr:discoidin domain-containing protein [Anaerolineae bacterium]
MPDPYPSFIFGMHDRGGEHLMLEKGRPGWVLVTEAVGADPGNHAGSNYTDLTNQGLGVIVRLNHGYGNAGTIPNSAQYEDFGRRCGNFVQASPGCRIWIIGNEMNSATERPGGPNGQVITPQRYASCFLKCRNEIRRRPGHAEDQVLVGAVAPWNVETRYPGNLQGDWIKYFMDTLSLLGQEVDGIALHTYTHGQNPTLIYSNVTMEAPYEDRYYHFRGYRNFMEAIPPALRDRPVYITATDQYGAWRDENTGWARVAYREINEWNRDPTNQPIQALILYRWITGNAHDPQEVGWAIQDKPGVQHDFRAAMNNDYRLILPSSKPAYRVAWLEVGAPGRFVRGATATFRVRVRNAGRIPWATTGTQAVRLGHRWIDASGSATEGQRTALPQPVEAGETVTLPAVTVKAPDKPGFYTLELDLVEGVSGWFAEQGAPVWRAGNVLVGNRYRVAWLDVDAPEQGSEGRTTRLSVHLRNEGALTWVPGGDNPFHLSYRWLDPERNVVLADGLRTPLRRAISPLEDIRLEASIRFPATAGDYILQLDMVHEFSTWFQWKGSPVYESVVGVQPDTPEYAAEWLDYTGPERLLLGDAGRALLKVENTGLQTWEQSGADAISLGYRWFDERDREVPVGRTETIPSPEDVEAGATTTFRDVPLLIPRAAGAYRLVWDLMQGKTWLSERGVAVLERPFQVIAPEYGVAWEVLRPWPAWMPPDEVLQTDLHLRNTGTKPWMARGERPVHLAYTWFMEDGKPTEPWDTFRIQLPRDVLPGDTLAMANIGFKTPPLLGNYILRWDLVEEGQTWLFRRGAAPLEVPVEVSDQVLFAPWAAQASHNPRQAELAFDGQAGSVWDSKADQIPGMWFLVDLGQALVLDRVRVSSPGRGFPLGYKIHLSDNGRDWHLVAQGARNWANIDVAFAPCQARYMRLEQTGQADRPASWMISEIRVSATAPWRGAEASHHREDTQQAIDGDLRTAWSTQSAQQEPGMWFEVDMGNLRRIEGVTLEHPSSQMPRGFVVKVSADRETWQEVGRRDENWTKPDVRFPAIAARHVRVETTNSSPDYPWGIASLTVWRTEPVWLVGRQDS